MRWSILASFDQALGCFVQLLCACLRQTRRARHAAGAAEVSVREGRRAAGLLALMAAAAARRM
eukprot:3563250-Pleurochrysis_carterae.AAC.1